MDATKAAIKEKVDVIGLSGLITPSLDEMVYVAAEMERRGMVQPLLIGGATTSPAHTAVKIDPVIRSAPVVHVTDASRAVGVVSTLLSEDEKDNFVTQTKARYVQMRESRAGGPPKPRLPIADARKAAMKIDWAGYTPPKPTYEGVKTFKDFDLATLARYIDWTPYFSAWDLAGRFPQILEDETVGEAASSLWRDTQAMMQKLIGESWFQPQAVVGFWKANAEGDDIRLGSGDVFHTLRQQMVKDNTRANFALSDFVAPEGDDWIGGFCVTAGPQADEIAEEFKQKGDDYSSIIVKALADRFAEALAENAKDADAALKLLATLTGRGDVRSSCAASAIGRVELEFAARAAARLAERADDDNDAAAVRRHVASVAPCPGLVDAIAEDAPANWLARADAHMLEEILKIV